MNSDELIRGMAEDRAMQCLGRNMVTNTDFLDAHQQSVLRLVFREPRGCGISFWGGYEDADRRIMVCLPDYADMEAEYVTGRNTAPGPRLPARDGNSVTGIIWEPSWGWD